MKKKLVTHSIGAMGPTGRDAVSTLASTLRVQDDIHSFKLLTLC